MGKTATNLAIALGLITIAFAGYYMYTQSTTPLLNFKNDNEQVLQNMLQNTQVFIERSKTLDKVTLDISFFEDKRFRSLRSFTTPIPEKPIGRPDPFAETQATGPSNF